MTSQCSIGPLSAIDYDDIDAGPSHIPIKAPVEMEGFKFDVSLNDLPDSLPSEALDTSTTTTSMSTSAYTSSLMATPFYKLLQSVEASVLHSQKPVISDALPQLNIKTSGEELLWVDKYRPAKFTDLLTMDRVPVEVLKWATHWRQQIDGTSTTTQSNSKRLKPNNNYTLKDNVPSGEGDAFSKILLLAGPPGLGKSTLAHIVAKTAGFEVVEINASDERSGEGVVTKVMSAISSNSMKKGNKPNLVIVDEIDGAFGGLGASGASSNSGGGDKNLISLLLKLASSSPQSIHVDDEAASDGEGADDKEPDLSGKTKKKNSKSSFSLRRPIICICNDLYVPALRPLRSVCQVLTMRKPSSTTLTSRLRDICVAEGLKVDGKMLMDLVDMMEGDIRGCIHALQFLSRSPSSSDKNNSTLSLSSLSSLSSSKMATLIANNNKDFASKGVYSAYEEIFCSSRHRMTLQSGVLRGGEDGEKIALGVFQIYPQVKFHDDTRLSKVNEAMEWYNFMDQCQMQGWDERLPSDYAACGLVKMHLLFATPAPLPKDLNLKADFECYQETLAHREILREYTHLTNRHQLDWLDRLPSLVNIIRLGSRFRLANPQLLKADERQRLQWIAQLMAEEKLCFKPTPLLSDATGSAYEYVLDPPIHRLTTFPSPHHHHDASKNILALNQENAAKQMINAAIESIRIRKSNTLVDDGSASRIGRSQEYQNAYAALQQKLSSFSTAIASTTIATTDASASSIRTVKRGFFTVIKAKDSPTPTTPTSLAKQEKALRKIRYHFNEGFTNAIRRNIKISDLFNKCE